MYVFFRIKNSVNIPIVANGNVRNVSLFLDDIISSFDGPLTVISFLNIVYFTFNIFRSRRWRKSSHV